MPRRRPRRRVQAKWVLQKVDDVKHDDVTIDRYHGMNGSIPFPVQPVCLFHHLQGSRDRR